MVILIFTKKVRKRTKG